MTTYFNLKVCLGVTIRDLIKYQVEIVFRSEMNKVSFEFFEKNKHVKSYTLWKPIPTIDYESGCWIHDIYYNHKNNLRETLK